MRRSLALIQPSLFEGWSTVVEDARLLGKKIILSDISVHVEQNPPLSTFFTPSSHIELATIIEEALPTLIPGPNIETENQAKLENNVRIELYAKNFSSILINSMQT
jgi:hypothetical protein